MRSNSRPADLAGCNPRSPASSKPWEVIIWWPSISADIGVPQSLGPMDVLANGFRAQSATYLRDDAARVARTHPHFNQNRLNLAEGDASATGATRCHGQLVCPCLRMRLTAGFCTGRQAARGTQWDFAPADKLPRAPCCPVAPRSPPGSIHACNNITSGFSSISASRRVNRAASAPSMTRWS